jgi:uncharacterized damage-inducible protein DinB
MSLLDEARAAWRYTRESVIAELRDLSPDQLHFRPTEQSRSVEELVRHVVQSGRMMCGELTRPDGDFTRQGFEDFLEEYAADVPAVSGRDALLELLGSSHQQGDARLEEAGEVFLLQTIRQFDGTRATRFSWLHHGISHEEYHRGQLALYARLLGRVPALTRRINGEG